jgi:hypothetical protein
MPPLDSQREDIVKVLVGDDDEHRLGILWADDHRLPLIAWLC